ncbi:unnamed protein product, partial [Amoebophrya sp. A25]
RQVEQIREDLRRALGKDLVKEIQSPEHINVQGDVDQEALTPALPDEKKGVTFRASANDDNLQSTANKNEKERNDKEGKEPLTKAKKIISSSSTTAHTSKAKKPVVDIFAFDPFRPDKKRARAERKRKLAEWKKRLAEIEEIEAAILGSARGEMKQTPVLDAAPAEDNVGTGESSHGDPYILSLRRELLEALEASLEHFRPPPRGRSGSASATSSSTVSSDDDSTSSDSSGGARVDKTAKNSGACNISTTTTSKLTSSASPSRRKQREETRHRRLLGDLAIQREDDIRPGRRLKYEVGVVKDATTTFGDARAWEESLNRVRRKEEVEERWFFPKDDGPVSPTRSALSTSRCGGSPTSNTARTSKLNSARGGVGQGAAGEQDKGKNTSTVPEKGGGKKDENTRTGSKTGSPGTGGKMKNDEKKAASPSTNKPGTTSPGGAQKSVAFDENTAARTYNTINTASTSLEASLEQPDIQKRRAVAIQQRKLTNQEIHTMYQQLHIGKWKKILPSYTGCFEDLLSLTLGTVDVAKLG